MSTTDAAGHTTDSALPGPLQRDRDQAAATAWLRDYVSKPSPLLGRTGPICPFVPAALDQDTVQYSLRYGIDGHDLDELTGVLGEEMASFRRSTAPPQDIGGALSLACRLVLLPDTDNVGWAALDRAYTDLKNDAVAHGLMIGQFHPNCDEHAVRNHTFPVSRAPIPLVAIRHMAPHDILFLHSDPGWFAHYQRRFGDVAGRRLRDPLLRQLHSVANQRHGTETGGPEHRCRATGRAVEHRPRQPHRRTEGTEGADLVTVGSAPDPEDPALTGMPRITPELIATARRLLGLHTEVADPAGPRCLGCPKRWPCPDRTWALRQLRRVGLDPPNSPPLSDQVDGGG